MPTINSPFRYAGGKFYARRLILELIPTSHNCYIEPFAGGGSIFFAKEKKTINILSDLDSDLINCYTQIRDHVENMINLLDSIKESPSKALHTHYKNEYQPTNDLERAFRWFYLNRISYSGIMKTNNCYWGYGDEFSMQPKSWPEHLRRSSRKLQDVILNCQDFEQTIDQAPDGAFLFVDPPYFGGGQRRFYTPIFTHDDHTRLLKTLRRNSDRIDFLLTYDDHPEVKKYYQSPEWEGRARIAEKSWNYTLSRTDDQTNGAKKKGKDEEVNGVKQKGTRTNGKEMFIFNYDPMNQVIAANEEELAYAEY